MYTPSATPLTAATFPSQIALHFARQLLQARNIWQLDDFMAAWEAALVECSAEVKRVVTFDTQKFIMMK